MRSHNYWRHRQTGWTAGDMFFLSSDIEWRLLCLELKLDLAPEQLGIEFKDPGLDEATALLRAGQKIEAIKSYRAAGRTSRRRRTLSRR